ncbi:MAG: glycosyltransferase [Bacteroidales bacterium]|nr:glycosyltransferase [Bacteroidales bacterium]
MLTTFLINNSGMIVLGIFAFAWLVQLFYYWFFYSRLAFVKRRPGSDGSEPVSVVIAAHNEAYKLEKNLPLVLEQDYPDFEVIVVNDGSHDETEMVLTLLAQQYPRLKVVNVTQSVVFFRSKKFPLSVGIKSAKNEILLLTDADCRPVSNQWIREMQASYDKDAEIVLGYGPYEKLPGLLNLFIRYDTFQIAIQYFSFALSGRAYMGVGRNLSYKKSLFYKHKGFINHYHISSGDDDLFINAAATRINTRIELNPASYVFSEPKKTLKSWITQKRRHFTTGRYYKSKYKNLLGIQAVSAVVYYLSLIYLLAIQFYWPFVLGAQGLRLISRMVLYGYGAKKLNERNLFLLSPMFDPFFTFFNPLLALNSLVFKSKKWK